MNQSAEAAGEIARRAPDAARSASKRATDTAKDVYHSAALHAEEALTTSKGYVRQNPVPAVLGAIAFGAALGFMLAMTQRKQTFGERYADEPVATVREAILSALAPMANRVHEGYDSALDGAGKAMDRIHHSKHKGGLSHQIGRVGSNLKFW